MPDNNDLFSNFEELRNSFKSVPFYMDAAKRCLGITSDRELCKRLGLKSNNAANFWRNGKHLPSDETMVKLANLAREDVAQALSDLHMLRLVKGAQNSTGAIQLSYKNMLSKMAHLCLIICGVTAMSTAAHAATIAPPAPSEMVQNVLDTVYYGNYYIGLSRTMLELTLSALNWCLALIMRYYNIWA